MKGSTKAGLTFTVLAAVSALTGSQLIGDGWIWISRAAAPIFLGVGLLCVVVLRFREARHDRGATRPLFDGAAILQGDDASNSRVVVIRRFTAEPEAELACGALKSYGVQAAIQRGPHSRPLATWDVLVREEDVEAATGLLGPAS